MSPLEELLQQWQDDASLRRTFAQRCEVAEQLDASMLGRALSADLQLQAAATLAQLEAADVRLFSRIRTRLRQRRYTGSGFVRGFMRHAAREDAYEGYAPLDVLFAGLFDAGELPEELPRDAEMVSYQPAPGRVILALLEHVGPNDVFYDIGAGLGRVVIAVALFAGARAVGIENQAAFCAYAARVAEDLQAREVAFVAQDARDAVLDDGTSFFLYTPFRGSMLRAVLDKLRALAAKGGIRVCTFGPCTADVAREPWLALRSGSIRPDELAVFDSAAL
jgi:SAM-dependent methyltransferase